MRVHALGACDPRCPWCAREFWRWLKGTLKRDMYATGAAATSIRPPRGEGFDDRE